MSAAEQQVWSRGALIWSGVVCTALYAGVTTLIFHSYVVTGFDNAIIEQVVNRLSRLSAPITDVEGVGVNYFGDHFSPVLAVYAPFYLAVPRPETLFVVQGAVLGLSVVVMLATATRYLGRRTGMVVTVLYALSFGMLNGVVISARETPFAVLLLTIAGASYLRGSTRGVVLASLALVLVKEDLGLTVAAIGFVLALKEDSRRVGMALCVAGIASFAVVVGLVLPAFREGQGSPYASSSSDMFAAMLDGAGFKVLTVALTFGVTGFAAFRSRWALIVLPSFAWRFSAPKEAYWTPLWHYSAMLMPIVFIAAIAVLHRSPARERRLSLALASTVTAVCLLWAALQSLAVFDSYGSPREVTARQALRAVPTGASVVSDEYLVGHLVRDRTTYYIVTYDGCPRAEYLVAHIGRPESNAWGGKLAKADFDDLAELFRFTEDAYGGGYELVAEEGSYAVLRRAPTAPAEPCTTTDLGLTLNSRPKVA